MPYYKEYLIRTKIVPWVGNSYFAESEVILIRRWDCIGKHETVGYGKIVNPQICKCHPVLQKNSKKAVKTGQLLNKPTKI